MALYKEYTKDIEEYNSTKAAIEKFDGYIISLQEMLSFNILTGDILNTVVSTNFQFNEMLKKKQQDLFKYKFKEFSICVLVNSEKKVWLSKRKDIKGKDYPNKIQATGGSVDAQDLNEPDIFLACAKREAYEESGIKIPIENIHFVVNQEGSRIFPNDKQEQLYKTALYFSDIGDNLPENMEPDKQDNWFLATFDEMKEYKKNGMMTGTLNSKLDELIKKINTYFVLKNKRNKKRKRDEEQVEKSNDISETDDKSEIVDI
jgi:8-oxo-dGTP pyrophosphatase MutT (NUDIX family)